MWLKHSGWIFSVFAVVVAEWSNENFAPGNEYQYQYELHVESSAVGTTNRKAGLDVDCSIRIAAKDKSQLQLFVDRCNLSELGEPSTDGISKLVKNARSDEFSLELTTFPTYFNLSQGSVKNIYFHENQSLAADNFKRGIISTLITRKVDDSIKNNSVEGSYTSAKEGRIDVQGYCKVYHKYGKFINQYTMVKDMKSCHFSSKPDWQNNPWSLFWNSSLFQAVVVNSSIECDYELNPRQSFQELKSVSCKERHARLLESTKNSEISVQTNVRQKLTLIGDVKINLKWKEMTGNYGLDDIGYKYASALLLPDENPTDAEKKMKQLVRDASVDLQKTSDKKDRTTAFGELIDYLREVPHFEFITQELIDKTKTKENVTPLRVHMMQVYRDALFQCHRAHCFKNFRLLLQMEESVLPFVVSDDYLNSALDALFDSSVEEDTSYLKEIKELCKVRPSIRKCPLVLASALNTLWYQNIDEWKAKSKIPLDIAEILDYLLTVANTGGFADNVLKFKIIGTLGQIIEIYEPDILTQLFEYEVTDIDRLPRIEATRKFKASDALYEKLTAILKAESHPQQERLAAYLILVDKWPEDRLSEELWQLFESNTTDFNVKTFLYSHLLALTRSTQNDYSKFARNMLTYVISEFKPGKHNSQYNEKEFSQSLSFLRKSISRLALKFQKTKLFNGRDPQPFYLSNNASIHWLGDEFELFEAALFTQGLRQAKEVALGAIGEPFKATLINNINKARKLSQTIDNWPYDIDSAIAERLQEIRKKITEQLKSTKPLDFLWSFRRFGDDSSFFTMNDAIEFVTKHQQKILKAGTNGANENRPRSISVRIIEANNLVPLLGGVAISWATDAYWLSKSEHVNSKDSQKIPFHFDFRVGISTSLQHRMTVEIPGYSDCGVQMLNSASLVFDAMVGFDKEEAKLHFGLPHQTAYISLARKNKLIRKHSLEDIPDWEVKRVKEDWCSDVLVPSVGLELCHSKSYPAVTDNPDKPWKLMAGDSHWKYTLRNVNNDRKLISIKRQKNDNKSRVFKLVLADETKDGEKNQKVIFDNEIDSEEIASQAYIGIRNSNAPHAVIKNYVDNSNITIKATLFLKPNVAYEIISTSDYQQKLLVPEATLNDRLRDNSTQMVEVHGGEDRFSLTTPENRVYTYKYQHRYFPYKIKIDYVFNYSCGLPCNTWVKDLLPVGLWDDGGNAMISYHSEHSTENRKKYDNYEVHNTYHLQTPKTIYEMQKINVNHIGVDDFYHFYLKKHSLPDHNLLTYFNVSFGRRAGQGKDGDYNFTQHLATLSVPQLTYFAELMSKESTGQVSTRIDILKLGNSDLPGSKSIAPVPPFQKIGFEFDLVCKDKSSPEHTPWSHYTSSGSINLTMPFLPTEEIIYNDEFKMVNFYESEQGTLSKHCWTHEFEARCCKVPMKLTSKTTQSVTHAEQFLTHSANFTHGLQLEAAHDFNYTAGFLEDNRVFYLKYHVVTPHVETTLNYVNDLEPCDDRKHGYGEGSLIVHYPSNPNNDIKFKGYACRGEKFLEGTFEDGSENTHFYGVNDSNKSSITVNVKSKHPGIESRNKSKELTLDIPNDYPDNPAVIKFDLPRINELVYILVQGYSRLGQYVITACNRKMCTDLQNDPDSFIIQTLWDYHDDYKLFHSVTINTNETLANLPVVERFQKWIASPISIDKDYLNLEDLLEKINDLRLTYTHPLGNCLIEFAAPIVKYNHDMKSKEWKSSQISSLLSATYIPWLWNYFNATRKTAKFLLREFDVYNSYKYEIPNGRRFVDETEKLFSFRFDYMLPYIRPNLFRELVRNFDMTRDHFNFHEVFYEIGYDRFAFLFSNKNVITFDNHFVGGVASNYSGCPFMVTHDVTHNQFTVYDHDGDLHFLFPNVHLRISRSGEVIQEPNGNHIGLPFSDKNNDVRVLRKESVLTIGTDYDLMVKCVDGQFCLFYTSVATFGQLAGLLGNNNDITEDDVQPFERWNLSKGQNCIAKLPEEAKNSGVGWGQILGNVYKEAMFQCKDVVDTTPFYPQIRAEFSDSCATGAAYLALCGARDTLIVKSFPECSECQGHDLGQSWLEHIEDFVEIVFVVNDQNEQLVKSEFIESLQTLMSVISQEFAANKFKSVKFGFIGICHAHWHKVKGEHFYTADEFIAGSKPLSLRKKDEADRNSEIYTALHKASKHQFNPKALRIVALLTDSDSMSLDQMSMEVEELLDAFEKKGITFHTFSNYPELSKSNAFGMTHDRHYVTESKSKNSAGKLPKGVLAKLSVLMEGGVWLLSNFETKSASTKAFMQSVSEELVAGAKQHITRCRRCTCSPPDFYEPEITCDYVPC